MEPQLQYPRDNARGLRPRRKIRTLYPPPARLRRLQFARHEINDQIRPNERTAARVSRFLEKVESKHIGPRGRGARRCGMLRGAGHRGRTAERLGHEGPGHGTVRSRSGTEWLVILSRAVWYPCANENRRDAREQHVTTPRPVLYSETDTRKHGRLR
eukprot:6247471-Prymnesium_polylepis.1